MSIIPGLGDEEVEVKQLWSFPGKQVCLARVGVGPLEKARRRVRCFVCEQRCLRRFPVFSGPDEDPQTTGLKSDSNGVAGLWRKQLGRDIAKDREGLEPGALGTNLLAESMGFIEVHLLPTNQINNSSRKSIRWILEKSKWKRECARASTRQAGAPECSRRGALLLRDGYQLPHGSRRRWK